MAERVAREYHSNVVARLAVSAAPDADASDSGVGAQLADAMRSALAWLQGWVSAGGDVQQSATATERKASGDQQVAANDRLDADAAADEKRRVDADQARRKEEAELKARAAERKAEVARRHEENERAIAEKLKQLDKAHKRAEEKRRETERVKEEAGKAVADRRVEGDAGESAKSAGGASMLAFTLLRASKT